MACSESSSYLLHSEIEPPPQKKSQRSTVFVPDFCGDLFDTRLTGLQEMYRAFHSQTLEIRHRRFPKDTLQPPSERPFACTYGSGSTVEGKSTRKPGTCPAFETVYHRVGVDEVIRKSISSLRRP